MEQATGIGPAPKAWEALILPLNYACGYLSYYHITNLKATNYRCFDAFCKLFEQKMLTFFGYKLKLY